MTQYDPTMNTFATTAPKKTSWLSRWWPVLAAGALGLVIGGLAGGSGASEAPGAAEPQPVKTVEVEKIVEVEVPAGDNGCVAVAEELYSMLQDTTNEIVIPQNQVTQTLIDNLLNGLDVNQINEATSKVEKIIGATDSLTSRAQAIGADYQGCVNG